MIAWCRHTSFAGSSITIRYTSCSITTPHRCGWKSARMRCRTPRPHSLDWACLTAVLDGANCRTRGSWSWAVRILTSSWFVAYCFRRKKSHLPKAGKSWSFAWSMQAQRIASLLCGGRAKPSPASKASWAIYLKKAAATKKNSTATTLICPAGKSRFYPTWARAMRAKT